MNLPSGPGQTDSAHSVSVVSATDDPGNAALATVHTDLLRLAPLGPGPGSATPSASRIFNVSFSANAASPIDLTTGAWAGLKAAIDAGKLLVLKATATVWYNWGTSGVTISTASTALSNPATQGIPVFDGGESPERAPAGTTFLNIRGGPVDGVLCIYVAEA